MKVNARTYIASKLEGIINKISTLKFYYKYDSLSNEHLVKVVPVAEYYSNEQY